MLTILWSAISFILRGVVVKFVMLTAVFGLMAFVIPKAIQIVSPALGVTGLSNSFSGLPSGVWWVLDAFSLGYGIPLILSAFIARFLIRRLPVIG